MQIIFSPRHQSQSTFSALTEAQSNSSDRSSSLGCVEEDVGRISKGYAAAVSGDDEVQDIVGTFPPADPYIYCQNSPGFTGKAASVAWISIILTKVDVDPELTGWLQMGWAKYRPEGDTNIYKKLYLEIAMRLNRSDLGSDAYYKKYFMNMPGSNFVLRIARACNNGAPSFHMNGGDVTPPVGNEKNQISQELWNRVLGANAKSVKTGVEVWDLRSHVAGKTGSKYEISDVTFSKCGNTARRDAIVLKEDVKGLDAAKIDRNGGRRFLSWDTRA
jgi:hypothetical protein